MAHILVVEDDEQMNEMLETALQSQDHTVATAMNAQQAIERCKGETFDLIITDVRLPGMDGVEMLAQIKKIQPRTKSIVITGYASEDTPVRAIRCQVSDYLFKPFSLKYFLRSVDRTLQGENEKKSKLELVGRLFQKFGMSMGRVEDEALERLVEQRQEAFRGLFVGIRSDYLGQRSAFEVYTFLESLETRFRRLLNEGVPKASEAESLERLYLAVQMRRDDAATPQQADGGTYPGIVLEENFVPLYQAIKESEISFEELLYAPLLRITADSRFETMKELVELKRKLWPKLPRGPRAQ